jgi:branched-chain amino acid transport system permease protein
VLAGALAGLAGFLLAVKDGFVNPELLSWHESGAVLLMIILGGIGHLRGAVIGAVAFVLLKELYATPALVGATLADHWQLTLGFTIIAFVALLPKGLIGLPQRWRQAHDHAAVLRVADAPLRRADRRQRRDAGRSSWARCTP